MAPRMDRMVIACIKFTATADHYVAVLGVDEDSVMVGDPLSGEQTLAKSEFLKIWRRTGIEIRAATAD